MEQIILRPLAYFAVFRYPLLLEEILWYAGIPAMEPAALQKDLQQLVQLGVVSQYGDMYQLGDDPEWLTRRLEANERAKRMLPRAQQIGRFIGQFPFVRSVFISGAVSKQVMGPESDVDFFIVTDPGRLWLARTLLILFKKVFLLNSHRYFCVNYFVDTNHLEIIEKNLFTATETVTLMPVWGNEGYMDFCRINQWAKGYYPYFPERSTENAPGYSRNLIKKVLEWVWRGAWGNRLDQKAMEITIDHWKRKFKHMDAETFDLALKSRKGISKHHPLHFQQKVLEQFEQNLETALLQLEKLHQ
ncbi:MAG TPA: nucleotidyltransferase [Saprospirales bacterium]|nr:nucleotidyltransferase [Saprospirales bacterium]